MNDLLARTVKTAERIENELHRLAKIIRDSPESPESYVAAGRIQEYANHLNPAVECYRRAVKADPKNGEARGRLAIALLKLNNAREALAVASELCLELPETKFLSLDSVPTSAMTVLADALRAKGSPYALDTYEKALHVEPADSYAAGCLAELLLIAGKLPEALKLQDRIADTMNFSAIRSSLRLASNDPQKLPALIGVNHHELMSAGHV